MLHDHAIHAEREALQNQKLKTLGMLSSCMAHEVKNPLSTIRTIASVMAEQLGNGSDYAGDLEMIVSEVDRVTHRTNELLGFARPADVGQACDSMREVVEATARFFGHRARQLGVELRLEFSDNLPALSADENSVRDILFNLIGNSLDAAKRLVSIDCRRDGEYLVTVVADDGPGIPDEIAEHLFEPFATTKADGTGLGLYIVRQRVHSLRGEIQCGSQAGQGTRFTLRLPGKPAAR